MTQIQIIYLIGGAAAILLAAMIALLVIRSRLRFDLAAVIAYHDLGPAAALHLLRDWSGRVSPRQRQRLAALIRAHDALHWLWLAAGGDRVRERRRLECRLEADPLQTARLLQ